MPLQRVCALSKCLQWEIELFSSGVFNTTARFFLSGIERARAARKVQNPLLHVDRLRAVAEKVPCPEPDTTRNTHRKFLIDFSRRSRSRLAGIFRRSCRTSLAPVGAVAQLPLMTGFFGLSRRTAEESIARARAYLLSSGDL